MLIGEGEKRKARQPFLAPQTIVLPRTGLKPHFHCIVHDLLFHFVRQVVQNVFYSLRFRSDQLTCLGGI